ncbi:hypothetical protein ALC53_06208 [Atta colombica]|uniref:Uncharacterized protein n=1 Tax=Atta colombica TaxID=520822 RepID=A0A195BFE1_9HYME|nr:hypothetical protein ALC53_06208 [Atta colombica]
MLLRLQMNLRRDEFSNFMTLELLAIQLKISHRTRRKDEKGEIQESKPEARQEDYQDETNVTQL